LVLVHQRQQNAVFSAAALEIGEVALRDILVMFHKPSDSLRERGQFTHDLGFQRDGGVERDETDETSHRHLMAPRPAPGNGVVVETVLLVPQRLGLSFGAVAKSVTDQYEVLEEL